IQDNDRGIIIGDTSFGKASVQRIFPLDAGYKLKLTTAFYHLPSGRLIHKKDKLSDVQKFKTLHLKREVLGGIGIIPEIIIREREFSTFSQTLSLKNYFFNFATEYYNRTGKSEVTEEVLEEFWKYILSKEKNLERENFEKAKEEIRMLIDIELSEKKKGIKGRYEALLKYDNVFKKAIEILKKAEKRDDVFSSK
ncbi:MAG: S41 family peptidase, partial [candidate division WOR-3 bacterium]